MIQSKKQLSFFIMADMMMNRGKFKMTFLDRLKNLFISDDIMKYLEVLRKTSFYKNSSHPINKLLFIWYYRKLKILGQKLGFSIGVDSLGYGVVIPHHGTIVIGGAPRIGNYAVLHTSTCISDNKKVIGDGLYLATGAKITSEVTLGDYVSIGANSVVNKSFLDNNVLIAGIPARIIKEESPWFMRDGKLFEERVARIELLKSKMGLLN